MLKKPESIEQTYRFDIDKNNAIKVFYIDNKLKYIVPVGFVSYTNVNLDKLILTLRKIQEFIKDKEQK